MRNEVDPGYFFSRKAVISADVLQKKAPVKFFWYWCRKGVSNRKTRFTQKKNKRRCNAFVSKWRLSTPKSSPWKVRDKFGKIKFHTRNRNWFHHLQLYLLEWRLFDNYIHFFFFFWLTVFVFLDALSLFHIVPIWIWLFEFPIDVIFAISCLGLSVNGVLWRPRSCRRSCQIGYLAVTTWELLAWAIKTPVSIICNHFFGKGHCPTTFCTIFVISTNVLSF